MLRKLLLSIVTIAGLVSAITNPALAGKEVNVAPGGVLVDGKPAPGLAIHGYDPVAYFKQNKPVQGEAGYATVYKKATYRFSSKENLQTFKSNPEKYTPAYGGFCAYGVSVNAKFDGDPRFFKIHKGKLYLNLDKKIASAFNKDVDGAVKKAEANWPGLKNK